MELRLPADGQPRADEGAEADIRLVLKGMENARRGHDGLVVLPMFTSVLSVNGEAGRPRARSHGETAQALADEEKALASVIVQNDREAHELVAEAGRDPADVDRRVDFGVVEPFGFERWRIATVAACAGATVATATAAQKIVWKLDATVSLIDPPNAALIA